MAPKNLEVTVVRCRDLAKVQMLGKQDPYIILKYDDQEFRSKTCQDGGTEPIFNESFSFVVKEGVEPKLSIRVLCDKAMKKEDLVGSTKLDFSAVFEKGHVHKPFQLHDAKGNPHGTMELHLKCPEVISVLNAAEQMEATKIAGQQERYNAALAEARGKHYAVVAKTLAPFEEVTGSVGKEHMGALGQLQREEEKEMGGMFSEPRQKAEELVELLVNESSDSTATTLKALADGVAEKSPDAERFRPQLNTFTEIISDYDKLRASEYKKAEQVLLAGITDALNRYRAIVSNANERYETGFGGAVLRYKKEIEAELRAEAERKSLAEAAAVAPPPAVAPAAAAAPPPPVHHSDPAPRSPRAAAAYPAPYTGHYAAPAPAAAYPAYTTPAPGYTPYSAPPPGYPMTQAEIAQMEAEQAKAHAREAEEKQRRAEAEAAAARQEADQAEAMMEMGMRRAMMRRAVRRGVVGGVLLARAID